MKKYEILGTESQLDGLDGEVIHVKVDGMPLDIAYQCGYTADFEPFRIDPLDESGDYWFWVDTGDGSFQYENVLPDCLDDDTFQAIVEEAIPDVGWSKNDFLTALHEADINPYGPDEVIEAAKGKWLNGEPLTSEDEDKEEE
jgi:hypothetical protein|nr:MAG TPA: hypothetical protein [Caudoviricetes sp.]